MASEGSLVLVATPLGNLGDLSPRAADALRAAQLWIVEDTRVSGKLAAHLGIKVPMRVLNDHTSPTGIVRYADEIEAGVHAALLTDAGTPAISDPGALLVDALRERQVSVEGVPGPSAVTTALMLSGFFAQRFAFLGYLPRKPGALKSELEPFAESTHTLVCFESPHRVDKLLEAMYEVLGTRRVALCRELTKMHEQVARFRLPSLPSEAEVPRKGEFTVVVEGRRRKG